MKVLRYLFWLLLAILFVLLLLFAVRNTTPVRLRFFRSEEHTSELQSH